MPQPVTLPWHSDMQLASKLVLSAAALLLLTLAYRFYKSRSLGRGKIPSAEARREQRETTTRDEDSVSGLRRRRVMGEEARRDGGDGQGRGPGTQNTAPRGDWRLPRDEQEEEEEEGEKMVSELGLTCRRARIAKRGSEVGSEVGHELGSKLGSKIGIEPGSDVGSKLGSDVGSELGSGLANKAGNELRLESGSKLGSKLGSEPGIELGSDLGSKLGSGLASKPGNQLGSKLGSELGSETGNEPGNKLGRETESESGSKLGSELSFSNPGDTVKTLSSTGEEGTLAPSTRLSPRIAEVQMAGDRCAQSMEQDLAGGGVSREAEGRGGMIQTLSVTSEVGLTMMVSNVGSDASYSFSSVAKIQVEENYIAERRVKDRAGQLVPGLKGKVYDYYIQSISQSVSKRRSLPYIPPGTSWHHSLERVNEKLQSFATQKPDPASAAWDPTTSSIVPPPMRSLEISPEPPSPGHKDSILQIANSPHLQLPMEVFGVTAPVSVPLASPHPGLVAGADLFQMPSPTHLDLGNCYEVLCTAKAQKLGHLQEAAYKVMSDNYLQVLRTPSIYGRLNAGERELILQQRMKGKMYVAAADINMQEPSLHTSRLCYYDDGEDCWHHLCHVPLEVVSRGCAMCSMFNYLFVVAGCEGTGQQQRASNRVFCYDPLTNIWREICPLNQARPHCKLVALDGHLYAIGGECLYTVERYDPRQDRWTFTAPLPHDTFAVAHTATVCDGEIYVTGGTLRYVLLRYTARSDSWKVSLACGRKDRTAEMVSASGFIYRFDLHRNTGISVYRCGTKAKLWYECATYTMPNPSIFQCAVVGSLVHCVGRHFHIRFLADHISPRFGTKKLQPFPSPHGSLLPVVLVLPGGGTVQTQV
ncbi:PREDICTED: LOW QUALITY PROTEIN: kelch domain-containing protein 7A [Chlamydotis macqueenii]|uniref:LOW QUALITY PROTEIN: kelch domain-containing protein 7A n=1 Tax=Chlamydotis macqueenii TaxID=187382 RepID=UPI000529D075|nr:PREDICTED: LOW QUALITY PROTEIN: kelch domain-containing protein 7A [Chlamydotis macqueenii]